jgi:hypothetical protein
MKKTFLLAMIFAYCTQTMVAQTITEGSRWWNGERLYTAHVDGAGNITMDGESERMGSDTFILMKEGNGHYTLTAGNKQGWLFVRGEVGWQVENLTIGHTEYGYCDGGVIGFEGGRNNIISDCDLYGCGTFGIVGRSLGNAWVKRTKIHHCTYGIMDLYDCWNLTFEDCDFFSNKENPLISNGSSLNTTFRGCRIYDNWAEGELFSTNEPIRLFGCEIHHPRIGDIDSLVTDNHCLIDGMSPVMPPRTKPIGPDVD